MRGDIEKGATREAGILTRAELQTMMSATKITSKEEEDTMRRQTEEQKGQQMMKAKARKARMQAADRERSSKLPISEIEQGQRDLNQGLLVKAQKQMDEDLDDVKHMN